MQIIVKKNNPGMSQKKKSIIFSVVLFVLWILIIIIGFLFPADKNVSTTESVVQTTETAGEIIETEKDLISKYNKDEIDALLIEKRLKDYIPQNALLIVDNENNVFYSDEKIKEIEDNLNLKQFIRTNIEFNERDKKTFENIGKTLSTYTYFDENDDFLGKISIYKKAITFEINAENTTAPIIYYFPII